MRQAVLLVLMISSFILGGCKNEAQKSEEEFKRFRNEFLASENITLEAEVESLAANKYSKFKLSYEKDKDSERIKVIEPDLIADISAEVKGDKGTLCYDGVVLETGTSDSEKTSPVNALPLMMKFLNEGYVKSVGIEKIGEKELVNSVLELPDGLRMSTYFDNESNSLFGAAIIQNGNVILRIKIL